ncbi:dienelactone hydrolase [Pullulanibacillus pueri]|uniref:Peptidase S9 prolyl oligopeptidase catalytic domain-containing protein n=1 Tax=Pullulanibacillus pueri TaxID=1437324 RepID=A0A8J2ZUI1_9BACL|nr:alpha/beta hydrolase [Pullulanibacillus pueri]MBM7681122.1 dienelactone hydrolase [Pullulanibacillus pueri]GGH77129.1 hypothetical protein GCM10007096_08570 [Pullulanibacillus pueri]
MSAWDNGADNAAQDVTLLADSPLYGISIAPMYRGYGKSHGTVKGLDGDTIDTNNAIKAITTYFNSHKPYPDIQEDHIYLSGTSMGGGVALNIATLRKDITSVVAISPFVGWDIVGAYDEKHRENPIWSGYLKNAISAYGDFDPNSSRYKAQSIDYRKITAPVLLVQGTDDYHIPWETVQTFYKKMKQHQQKVTFKLIIGGNHSLSNKTSVLDQVISEWYNQWDSL